MVELRKYAVFGNPIMHSNSPNLFNSFAENNNLDSHYTRIYARDKNELIHLFKKLELSGANVTAPFKSDVLDLVSKVSENAGVLEIANIILNEDGYLKAYNSDIEGVFHSLIKYKHKIKSALVIGGGDSAKAAIYALRIFGIKRLAIYNRSIEKAYALAAEFQVQVCDERYLGVVSNEADLILSTINPEAKAFNIIKPKKNAVLFDAVYKYSKLKEIAIQNDCDFIGGDQWLINQAKPTFELFEGIEVNEKQLELYRDKSNMICLIGFMGAGKTTIGKLLSKKLNRHFIDLDELIEKSLGLTIEEIFLDKGVEKFRELEYEFLESIDLENTIISCGGGSIELYKTRENLKNKFFNIYLFSTFDQLYDRIEESNRPLVNKLTQLELYELFLSRQDHYFDVSDYIIQNNGLEDTLEILIEEIESNF